MWAGGGGGGGYDLAPGTCSASKGFVFSVGEFVCFLGLIAKPCVLVFFFWPLLIKNGNQRSCQVIVIDSFQFARNQFWSLL